MKYKVIIKMVGSSNIFPNEFITEDISFIEYAGILIQRVSDGEYNLDDMEEDKLDIIQKFIERYCELTYLEDCLLISSIVAIPILEDKILMDKNKPGIV